MNASQRRIGYVIVGLLCIVATVDAVRLGLWPVAVLAAASGVSAALAWRDPP